MNKLKDKIANFLLKRARKSIADKLMNLKFKSYQNAKNILLIAYPRNAEEVKHLENFEKQQKKEGKHVTIAVFSQLKDKQPILKFPENFITFSKKDYDWLGRPKAEEVKKLFSQNFDILIDLNFNHIFALEYISQLSLAAFKVGKFSEKAKEQFDFMIEMKKEQRDYQYFLNNSINYLKKIN